MIGMIRIDNKRAERAFRKGLNDLNDIWPEIELAVEKSKDEIQLVLERLDVSKKEQMDKYEIKLAEYHEYEEKIKQWRSRESCWFGRGVKPEYVPYPCHPSEYLFPALIKPRIEIHIYESIKGHLIENMNVANAAEGPYDVPHSYANQMVTWENGERIKSILAGLINPMIKQKVNEEQKP